MGGEKDDGGPAFACMAVDASGRYGSPGMSLRDWFAGQALSWAGHGNWTSSTPRQAERAYQVADAMLAARGAKYGGPAFACMAVDASGDCYGSPGMSLRDWFAGQALSWAGHDNWTSSTPKHLAERAYQMADAMLAARGQS